MYESKSIELSASTIPLTQLRCSSGAAGPIWVPLQQDWSKRWCTMPQNYQEQFAERIDGLETCPSDVFVVSFIKSGTTWMQEIAWLLLNDLDFERAKKSYAMDRSVYMEYSSFNSKLERDSVDACAAMPHPRLIKSHLPAQFLPRQVWLNKRKIIYVARNLKDVVVSSYHFRKGLGSCHGELDDYIQQFMGNQTMYTSYWPHVVDFYRMRNEENVFFVTYEEMKRNLKEVIERLIEFLGITQLSDKQMELLLEHTKFENMKASEFSNLTGLLKKTENATENFEFMRRGIVGSYEDELTAKQIKQLDNWSKHFLKEYGLVESDIFDSF